LTFPNKNKNIHYFILPRKETSVLDAHSENVWVATLLPIVNLQKPLNSRFPSQTCVLHANSAPKPFVPLSNHNQVFTRFAEKPYFHIQLGLNCCENQVI